MALVAYVIQPVEFASIHPPTVSLVTLTATTQCCTSQNATLNVHLIMQAWVEYVFHANLLVILVLLTLHFAQHVMVLWIESLSLVLHVCLAALRVLSKTQLLKLVTDAKRGAERAMTPILTFALFAMHLFCCLMPCAFLHAPTAQSPTLKGLTAST